MIKILFNVLTSALTASVTGFLFWVIVTELQKGNVQIASIAFSAIVFGILLRLSIEHDEIEKD